MVPAPGSLRKRRGNSTAGSCWQHNELQGVPRAQRVIRPIHFGSTRAHEKSRHVAWLTDDHPLRWWKRDQHQIHSTFCEMFTFRKFELEDHGNFTGDFGQKIATCFTCKAIAQAYRDGMKWPSQWWRWAGWDLRVEMSDVGRYWTSQSFVKIRAMTLALDGTADVLSVICGYEMSQVWLYLRCIWMFLYTVIHT